VAKTARTTAVLALIGTFHCVSSARASEQRPPEEAVVDIVTRPADSHIRTESAAIKAAIDQAIERSATFRQMVRAIEDSDSIVFLTEGDCGHNEHACFTNVTTAGRRRILWVTIDLRKAAADWDVMGSIAHELRHTVEVISEPGVRSFGEKFGLYLRIGFHEKGGGFETMAALDAGNAVREEVRKFERQRKSK
jgi:hypothetical protein